MAAERDPRVEGRIAVRAEFFRFPRDVLQPLEGRIHFRHTAGGPLILSAVAALIWANAGSPSYTSVWDHELSIHFMVVHGEHLVKEWVNHAILPLFFFVVGLEIKHQLVHGELNAWRRAAMPLAMAVGGMLVPAGIYLALNAALGGSLEGWGVPVATDVAFALAIVAALGRRVPPQIRILLLAFAATDDMGGVLVIAIFYSAGVNWLALLIAAGLFLAVLFLAYYRVFGSYLVYMLLGVAFVLTLFHSGVHTTIAGVLLGLAVPARPSIGRKAFLERCSRLVEQCGAKARSDEDSDYSEQELHALGQIEELVKESQSPVERLQELLTPFVSYLVLPIFALANAGVQVGGGMLNQVVSSPIAWGVVAGLVAGKPVGIVGGGYLAFRLGLANLPSGLGWLSVIGIGLLAGIGFTVSLFIAQLAFSGQPHLQVAKISILAASAAATLAGTAFFFLAHPARHSN